MILLLILLLMSGCASSEPYLSEEEPGWVCINSGKLVNGAARCFNLIPFSETMILRKDAAKWLIKNGRLYPSQ